MRTIHIRSVGSDRKMRLARCDNGACLLTDDAGNAYRFLSAEVAGDGGLVIGQKLQITFLPRTGFLLSVVPYLQKGNEKQMKKAFRRVFLLYLNGKYKYER